MGADLETGLEHGGWWRRLPPRWAEASALLPVNFFFMLIAHDPDGLFGPMNRRTPVSAGVVLLEAAFLVACVSTREDVWKRRFLAGGHYLLAGIWLTVLLEDWVVGAAGLTLNALLARQVDLEGRQGGARGQVGDTPAAGESLARMLRRAYLVYSAAGVGLALLVVGYRLAGVVWAVVAVFALLLPAVAISIVVEFKARSRQGWRGPWIEWVLLLGLPLTWGNPSALAALLALRQGVLLVRWVVAAPLTGTLVRLLFRNPAALLVVGFGGAILAGAVVLGFPVCARPPNVMDPVDALFTATSAVCVTGLIVVDTATFFSATGQSVILLLVQVGGLGIMTLSTFAAIVLGARPGFGQEEALAQIMESPSPGAVYRLVRFIVLVTFVIEGTGALVLFLAGLTRAMPPKEALEFGVFHAISAFCNAGFALQPDSLETFASSPAIMGTVSVLIITGGLGFAVLAGLWDRVRGVSRRSNAHTRLALLGTAVLLVAGTAGFLAFGWRDGAGSGILGRLGHAFFLSVTARTAGFNAVDMAVLGSAPVLLLIVLMFVGACPGSTGGGIKVTTAAILGLSVRATLLRREDVEVFGRRLRPTNVTRAIAIVAISMGIVALGLLVLLQTQDLPFDQVLFEAVSAFGTVGLSLGATAHLNDVGKLTIIALMFAGRVGPLTLALVVNERVRRRYRLPSEEIPVG